MNYTNLKRGAVGSMLALAVITTAIPAPRAEAATLEELQAQIQALIAQISALKNNTTSPGNPGSCSLFTADMTTGRSGVEVTNLQKFLIGRGHNIPSGATGFFGEQTRSALAQFQSQNNISPALGYFGPVTRSKVNALCTAAPAPTPGNQDNNNGGNTGTDNPSSGPVALQGEASLDNYEALEGEDTNLEEGQKGVPVMDVKFEVEDGDARVNRVDLGFTPDAGNDEKRPWRTFTEIGIYDGSKLLKKIDASNKSNWKENNPSSGSYLLRLSGIDWMVKEGETAELTVKVSTASSINGANNGEVWNVFVPTNGIRALDAAKVSIYTGDTADFITFDIDRGGSSDELIVKRSDNDPDATTLQLKDDARSGYVKVFAFDLDTDDSKNDIEIRKIPVQLTVSSGTVATYLRDARIIIDGKTFTKKTIVDGTTNTMTFEFGRGELVIDSGDRTTAEVEVEFKPLAASNEGVTISGTVVASGIVAEGSDDLSGGQLSGSATSETHVLRTRGIIGEAGSLSSTVTSVDGSVNDYGTFSVQVKVTAFGQDVYVPINVTDAITYQLENGSGAAVVDTGTAILTSNAKEQGGYFRIAEGETKTLTLEVTYQPGVAMTAARLQLVSINFNNSASAPTQTWNALPSSTYETATRTIVD